MLTSLCGKVAFLDSPPHIFTQAQREVRGFANDVIQITGFAPEAEFTAADVTRHAFRGGADARQLVIVNRARAVHGDVSNKSALDEVDHITAGPGFDDVRAHHQDAGRAFVPGGNQPLGHFRQLRMREFGRRLIKF